MDINDEDRMYASRRAREKLLERLRGIADNPEARVGNPSAFTAAMVLFLHAEAEADIDERFAHSVLLELAAAACGVDYQFVSDEDDG